MDRQLDVGDLYSSRSMAVVVVNFNGADDTIACIQSLMKFNTGLSIVIVDNSPGDTDLSVRLAAYPDVHLISPGENLGFGRANNLGANWVFQNTGCDRVLFLNNDACVVEGSINELDRALSRSKECGIAVPRIVLAENTSMLWYGGGRVDWKTGGSAIDCYLEDSESPYALEGRTVEFATGCAMLLRREVFEQTDGFDSRFFMYEEDLELSIRVRKLGWDICYVPSALIVHKVQGSMRTEDQALTGKWSVNNSSFDFHAYHMSRNKLLNAFIHARGKDALTFYVLFPLYLLAKLGPHIVRFRFGSVRTVIRGLHSAIREYF